MVVIKGWEGGGGEGGQPEESNTYLLLGLFKVVMSPKSAHYRPVQV